MARKPLQVAIVGLGGIGNTHARCYQKNNKVKLVAVCDILKERADKAAAAYDCKAFYTVQDMLKSGLKLDAVSVCTAGKENGGDHYVPTMELLKAGLPVLGEKPISNEISKAEEMVALARKKKIAYGVDLNHRFTPAAKQARQWMDAGRLGEVNMIDMFMWINNPNETSPHFHMRALHPHSFDILRYFGGEVKKVHAFFKKGPGRVCWSNVHVNLLFESGVIGHLMGSYDGGGPGTPWGLERCEIIGMDARIVLEDACEHLHFQPRKSIESETFNYLGGMRNFGETFQSRIDVWIDDLVKKTPPEKVDAKAADALAAQRIIEAAIESWDKGKVITL
jgi:predicted dehydrogenase